jgi:hypothetical protein
MRNAWNKGISNKEDDRILSGINHPFYNKHHTEETKIKIGNANRGLKRSDEFKINKSEKAILILKQDIGFGFKKGNIPHNKGKQMTDEQKKKISDTKKKNYIKEKHPMYGKKHTDEVKKRIGLLNSGKKWNKKPESIKKGEEHPLYGKNHTFESRKKMSMSKTGKKEFVDFNTRLNNLIRCSHKYKIWHNNIFKRDNYTCKICSKRGGDLEVHHIYPLSRIIKDNNVNNLEDAYNCKFLWNKLNAVTLCVMCHVKEDKYRFK